MLVLLTASFKSLFTTLSRFFYVSVFCVETLSHLLSLVSGDFFVDISVFTSTEVLK